MNPFDITNTLQKQSEMNKANHDLFEKQTKLLEQILEEIKKITILGDGGK